MKRPSLQHRRHRSAAHCVEEEVTLSLSRDDQRNTLPILRHKFLSPRLPFHNSCRPAELREDVSAITSQIFAAIWRAICHDYTHGSAGAIREQPIVNSPSTAIPRALGLFASARRRILRFANRADGHCHVECQDFIIGARRRLTLLSRIARHTPAEVGQWRWAHAPQITISVEVVKINYFTIFAPLQALAAIYEHMKRR